jgi:3'(2'), 5'-bisphosphate nucleotidase
MFEITDEIQFAIDAVRQASQLVAQIQSEMVTRALVKDDRSPVTVADFASQALIASQLFERFPNDLLVGEEGADALRNPGGAETLAQVTAFLAGKRANVTPELVCDWIDRGAADPWSRAISGIPERFWTLDPIDGTKGFLRGDQYAVALALLENGKVQLGVLGCPNLENGYQSRSGGSGSLQVAVRGQGSWTASLLDEGADFTPLSVSHRQNPKEARLLRSYESGHTNVNKTDELVDVLEVSADPVRMDSQAKYAVLASGHGDLLLRMLSPKQPDYKEKIWDQAAGSLIVEEAGGRVTDLHGRALDFTTGRTLSSNRGVLASNGYLHARVLEGLRKIGA